MHWLTLWATRLSENDKNCQRADDVDHLHLPLCSAGFSARRNEHPLIFNSERSLRANRKKWSAHAHEQRHFSALRSRMRKGVITFGAHTHTHVHNNNYLFM